MAILSGREPVFLRHDRPANQPGLNLRVYVSNKRGKRTRFSGQKHARSAATTTRTATVSQLCDAGAR